MQLPVWQKGMPQSMQRAAWVRSLSSGSSRWNLVIVVDPLVRAAAQAAARGHIR